MYMREMGTVELLTREGELRIAKRIEEGLNQVLAALSIYPRAVEGLLYIFEQVEKEERRLTDAISGFNDGDDEPVPPPAPPVVKANANANNDNSGDDDESEEAVDTGPDPEEVARRVQVLREHFGEFVDLLKERGRDDERSRTAMASVSEDFSAVQAGGQRVSTSWSRCCATPSSASAVRNA